MVWNPGVGRDDQGYLPSHTSYDPGHKSDADKGSGYNPGNREEGIAKNIKASQAQAAANAVAASNQQLYGNKFQKYDMGQKMATGFGSLFGASSGTTGSSKGVQDSIRVMVNNEIDKLSDWDKGDPNKVKKAADDAWRNFYPKVDQMTLEEYLTTAGLDPNNPNSMNSQAYRDWLAISASTDPGYANLMAYDKEYNEEHKDIANMAAEQHLTSFYSGGGGGGGGYGYGYGYGGGGGSGGYGYGYGEDEDPFPRGYQRGKVGPGGLLEAVNKLLFRISGLNKKRGGIISLLELS